MRKLYDKNDVGGTSPGTSPVSGDATTDWAGWPIYLGQYTDYSQDDSTDPSAYTWSRILGNDGKDGVQGLQGPKGDQGIQGPQGVSSYTHIAYANSADGKNGFDVGNGTGKTYIGIYVDSNPTDSTDPTKYTWTLIKGERGDQGIPGAKGADGRTPYFHIAYANIVPLAGENAGFILSSQTTVRFGVEASERWFYKDLPAGNYIANDGLFGDPAFGLAKVAQAFSDFSVTESSARAYIGTYTDYTQTDSTDPASYTWTKIKGETGATGPTGAQGPAGADGKSPRPNLARYDCLWASSVKSLSYDQTTNTYTIVNNTPDANWGSIVSIGSTNKVLVPYGQRYTASAEIYSPVATRIVIDVNNYANVVSSWAGNDNDNVNDRKISDLNIPANTWTTITWSTTNTNSANTNKVDLTICDAIGSMAPDGTTWKLRNLKVELGDSATPWMPNEADLIGPKGDTGAQGIQGPKGDNGQTTYVHFAYANSADGRNNFNVSYFSNALYVGTYTDYSQTDSNDYTRYTWSRLKGETGATGPTGAQGARGSDGTDASTISVKAYTFSAANGARSDVELTGPNAFKQTVQNRGHNVWVLDASTHKLREFINCDTYTTQTFNHNGTNTTLANYLSSLINSIVVIATGDADSVDQDLRNVLNQMGGSPELGTWGGTRVGHVFIGMSKRSDGTWPLQPRQGYEEAAWFDGSAPEIGCVLTNGGIVANGAKGDQGQTGATGPKGDKGDTGSTGFFTGDTPPSNPTIGTVWATNDSSGNMTSAKRWDGSKWVSTSFTQDLVAGTISASKIQSGELDINKITVKNAQNIPITSTVSLGDKLSNIEQDAEKIKFSMAGQGLDLVDGLDGELVMGYGIPNTTWDGKSACLTLPTTVLQSGEVLPQNAPFTTFYQWEAGKTYTQSIIIETNAQINTNVQPQWTWFTTAGAHNPQPAELVSLGNNCYRLIGSYTPNDNDARYLLRIIDIFNFTSFVNVTTGTYLKFRSPHFFCADDNSLSELKLESDNLRAYVKGSRGSKTLESILKMDPDHSSIAQVVNGQIAAAIGTYSDGSVRIDGKALYINADTKIDNATIKSAMIDSIEADKITSGTLDASQIRVINLDANSITTGSLSAVVNDLRKFQPCTVSASSPWNFDDTKLPYSNWFLIGETTADHVYNGPNYYWDRNQKVTPYMYVTSRGTSDGHKITVTVWKDNDPTQYQRVWDADKNSWSDWVIFPNSQNIVSTINLSPDSVKISGKNIELDGNTIVTGRLDLMQNNTNWVNQSTNYHNNWRWSNAHIYFDNYLQLLGENCDVTYTNTKTHLGGTSNFYSITTLTPGYLKFTTYNHKVNETDENFDGQISRSYLDSGRLETPEIYTGNMILTGSKIRSRNGDSLYITNKTGSNFDNDGSVGFQVWGGLGLGQQTIYAPSGNIYMQTGNVGPGFSVHYSDAPKATVHCQTVISQTANTVSSRLSLKTDITPVTYDRALAAVEGTEMYDYRYINDDSGQHYVSGIIDDVNPNSQYHMDDMLINKERTARIDANLVGYHHVVLQELLKKIDKLQAELNELKSKEN